MARRDGRAPHDEYGGKRAHYQAVDVADRYEAERWTRGTRRWSNRRKFLAITRAIALARRAGPVRDGLDLPCGTGRILPLLFAQQIRVVGADLSHEMMQIARRKSLDGSAALRGLVRCEAESLPFPDGGFDVVFSIRFLFHLPTEVRRRAVREMARVSRRWVILDYRHRYTLKYAVKRLQWVLGLSRQEYRRVSMSEIVEDFREAGVEIVRVFPTFPVLSDKWVILGRKIPPCG